jgi:hypothetical protein
VKLAYAELYFTERLWPDFGRADLDDALHAYAWRTRRFGGLATVSRRERKLGRRCERAAAGHGGAHAVADDGCGAESQVTRDVREILVRADGPKPFAVEPIKLLEGHACAQWRQPLEIVAPYTPAGEPSRKSDNTEADDESAQAQDNARLHDLIVADPRRGAALAFTTTRRHGGSARESNPPNTA